MRCLRRAKVNVLVRRRFEIVQGTAHATALDEEDMLEKTVEVEDVCCIISVCRHFPLRNGSCLRATATPFTALATSGPHCLLPILPRLCPSLEPQHT